MPKMSSFLRYKIKINWQGLLGPRQVPSPQKVHEKCICPGLLTSLIIFKYLIIFFITAIYINFLENKKKNCKI